VEQDGRVAPHPIQTGTGVVVANNGDAVFGVFKHAGKYELRRLTRSTNDLVRALDQPFGALFASDSELALLRWQDSTLALQTLSLTGEPRTSVTWSVPNGVAYARLRAAGGSLYVLVWGRSAPWVTLGRVTERGYEPLREASTNIAGPVALGAATLVGLDAKLELLESGTAFDAPGRHVTCLGTNTGQPYACADGNLVQVGPGGLGSSLFAISALREPDYQTLSEVGRLDCTTRWLDIREHIASSSSSSGAVTDGGGVDAATSDASVRTPSAPQDSGCSLSGQHGPTSPLCLLFLIVVVVSRKGRAGHEVGRFRLRSRSRRT